MKYTYQEVIVSQNYLQFHVHYTFIFVEFCAPVGFV